MSYSYERDDTNETFTVNTDINHEGAGMYDLGKDYQPGFYIWLSQTMDKAVDETWRKLIKGTEELWHS